MSRGDAGVMMEPDEGDEQPNTAWLLHGAYQAYVSAITDASTRGGHPAIRPAHGGNVFAHLDAEGSRLNDLAARAQIAPQSMSYLVDYLEAHGYVERVPDLSDRRAKLIRRTALGWEIERLGEGAIERIEGEARRRLGVEEMRTLRRLLRQLTAVLEDLAPSTRVRLGRSRR